MKPREPAGAEKLAALDKECAVLGKHRLEGREVHLGGVGFYLREVGVDGRIEGQARAESHLEVSAGPSREIVPAEERIARVCVPQEVHLPSGVGYQPQA